MGAVEKKTKSGRDYLAMALEQYKTIQQLNPEALAIVTKNKLICINTQS